MRILAPAKINLHLRVAPPRQDGFHPLLSWMVTVGLFDSLEIDAAPEPGVRLTCDDASLSCDASNLVVKIAAGLLPHLFESAGPEGRNPGISAALQKRIPVGAGLGGGSSDGAAALMALSRLFKLNWTARQLNDFGARFGSDLPFFLHGPSSICTGRGQIVSPTPGPVPSHAMLILPRIHVSTPAVYRTFDEMGLGSEKTIVEQPDWTAWARLPAKELLPLLVNDLEAPAFALVPDLARIQAAAAEILGRIVRMSGSGSTLFTLFDAAEEAVAAAQLVQQRLSLEAVAVEICPDSAACAE